MRTLRGRNHYGSGNLPPARNQPLSNGNKYRLQARLAGQCRAGCIRPLAWDTSVMARGQLEVTKTPVDELVAFETATRDLVGVALRSVEQLEVSLPQFRLLLALQEMGRSTSTDCAKALGVVGSSVTRLADRLHASGHLVRGSDPSNRSIVTLELTPQGRKLVKQVSTRRRRELSRVLDRIDPADRAACAAVLRTLHERFGDGYAEDLYNPMPL